LIAAMNSALREAGWKARLGMTAMEVPSTLRNTCVGVCTTSLIAGHRTICEICCPCISTPSSPTATRMGVWNVFKGGWRRCSMNGETIQLSSDQAPKNTSRRIRAWTGSSPCRPGSRPASMSASAATNAAAASSQ
jgi:hypothetical protein